MYRNDKRKVQSHDGGPWSKRVRYENDLVGDDRPDPVDEMKGVQVKTMKIIQDDEIWATDLPERFQLRSIPVQPCNDIELREEAEWIFRHCFSPTISLQKRRDYRDKGTTSNLSQNLIGKIKEALNFMRNRQFEVPFIAFYRKEYVEPELNMNDLWKVWTWDEKWARLQTWKLNLTHLFEMMQSYQFGQISADPHYSSTDGTRVLTNADIERLKGVQMFEELEDMYNHFLLYYSRDIPKMQNAATGNKEMLVLENNELVSHRNMYIVFQSEGLAGLAGMFGLTPEQFGENLRDNCMRHETKEVSAGPADMAKYNFCHMDPTTVLETARYMVTLQIAHEPLVRQVLRQTFQEKAHINITPTEKGRKESVEAHFAESFKYLSNKPVKELAGDEFLRMCLAEDQGLLSIDISIDPVSVKRHPGSQTYFDDIKHLYTRGDFSLTTQEWNRQRSLALEASLTQILYPQMAKELKSKLLAEARESVVWCCSHRLFDWLKVAPYRPDQLVLAHPTSDDRDGGSLVLGVAYATCRETLVSCALIGGEGNVIDVFFLANFMKTRKRREKALEVEKLKRFLTTYKPCFIAVAGENRDALMLVEDIKTTIRELERNSSLPTIRVELVDNELAKIYMSSKKSEVEFSMYTPLLRQAVSIARRVQDPLMEFAYVFSSDDVPLGLKLHPLQAYVGREDLISAVYYEFINRVNEVGVDVNKAMTCPRIQSLVPFVCGLGRKKSSQLLKILKHNGTHLETRAQLVTRCHMGLRVFINCAGFIKIEAAMHQNSTNINLLDGSRIHPEAYEWARCMATDALHCQRSAEIADTQKIFENPEPLKHLDLDAFAEQLERLGHGKKGTTTHDICAELSCRYRDFRVPYREPSTEQVFNMLTKETPETFYVGKLVTGVITGVVRSRPVGESGYRSIYNEGRGLWECPFCLQHLFTDLKQVWNHVDSGLCQGHPIGVESRLDNGVTGFIPTRFLNNGLVTKVTIGKQVQCRVMTINMENFSVDLTNRPSDVRHMS